MEKVTKSFTDYVYEKRRVGMNDKQIANSLGMSLKHFHKLTQGVKDEPVIEAKIEKKPETPVTKTPEIKQDPVIPMSMRAEVPNPFEPKKTDE